MEEYVDIKREFSLVAVRGDGDVYFYPPLRIFTWMGYWCGTTSPAAARMRRRATPNRRHVDAPNAPPDPRGPARSLWAVPTRGTR
ncbi:phosphoribosylaminoimidazole carboxylase [Thermoproteus tenax]|uniref:Phosphoribosylaminoimidazole carboxylase n=1 Tax=Thermoproteus tenax (strain ATCC 35583 / DSM 2078 / JCM 9277 / NBRC 100435 / Kra 1) TaxID=768679 RepID=G4RJW3_THETK|nr:phosphoribosylaminoimidazole carboxylase [Thermoproteus tenax Kra 1]